MNSITHPPSGLWKPHGLRHLSYGPDVVSKHLTSLLPKQDSKAFIITGSSISTKTPLVKQVEALLGRHHAGTCSSIKQHALITDLKCAAGLVVADQSIDTLISIGGGSPIDAAKWISIHVREHRQQSNPSSIDGNTIDGFLTHIAIPTTLSAAETTSHAAFTDENGMKTAIGGNPSISPSAILYDPSFAAHTPLKLWLATGIRALDHAVELMYHPSATEVPCKMACMYAVKTLFEYLPLSKASHGRSDAYAHEMAVKLFLAAFASLEFLGGNMTAGLGLSHALGYASGVTYGIPHGETSCLTLARVVKLKAQGRIEDAEKIARLLPLISNEADYGTKPRSEENLREDASKVGDAIADLVCALGLQRTLASYGVDREEVNSITARALGSKTGGSVSGVSEDEQQKVRELVEILF